MESSRLLVLRVFYMVTIYKGEGWEMTFWKVRHYEENVGKRKVISLITFLFLLFFFRFLVAHIFSAFRISILKLSAESATKQRHPLVTFFFAPLFPSAGALPLSSFTVPSIWMRNNHEDIIHPSLRPVCKLDISPPSPGSSFSSH